MFKLPASAPRKSCKETVKFKNIHTSLHVCPFVMHYNNITQSHNTGTQLLIVIIDATWNVNACYYEVSYASARSLRMRRSTSSALGP